MVVGGFASLDIYIIPHSRVNSKGFGVEFGLLEKLVDVLREGLEEGVLPVRF